MIQSIDAEGMFVCKYCLQPLWAKGTFMNSWMLRYSSASQLYQRLIQSPLHCLVVISDGDTEALI